MINPKLEIGKKMEDLAPKIICVFVLFSKRLFQTSTRSFIEYLE